MIIKIEIDMDKESGCYSGESLKEFKLVGVVLPQ